MKLNKVLLANVWADKNIGDFAIVVGTIKLLKKINPNVTIIAMSILGANEFIFVISEYKYLSSYVNRVIGGLCPTYFSYGYERISNIKQRILDIYSLFTSLGKLILISLSKKIGSRLLPEELLKSDMVILVGGNYINSSNIFGAMFYLFRILYPAFICIFLKKPYIVLGHTIWNINDVLSRALLRFVINRARLVVVREEESYKLLSSNIKFKNKIFVLPDLAFILADEIGNYRTYSRGSLTVGFSLRQWNFPGTKNPNVAIENYRNAISEFIKFLRTNYNAKILLIPFGSGPLLIEQDILECLEIFKRTNWLGEIYIVRKPSNLQEVFSLYSSLDIHIGVRLHSVIFASMCGVPSIVIGYQGPKAKGICAHLGISKYLINIDEISFDKLRALFEEILDSNNILRVMLVNNVKNLHRQLYQDGYRLLATLLS